LTATLVAPGSPTPALLNARSFILRILCDSVGVAPELARPHGGIRGLALAPSSPIAEEQSLGLGGDQDGSGGCAHSVPIGAENQVTIGASRGNVGQWW